MFGKATLVILVALLCYQLLWPYFAPTKRFSCRGLEHKSVASVYLNVGKDAMNAYRENGSEGHETTLEIERVYEKSISHAAELCLHHEHIFLGLTPILLEPDLHLIWAIDANGDPRVLMTVWGRRRYYDMSDNVGGPYPDILHKIGDTYGLFGIPDHWKHHTTAREIWLTPAPHLLEFCLAANRPDWATVGEAALRLRITQLLGLPPTCTYSDVISVWVKPRDLFRPCFDPEIEDYECQLDFTESSRAFVSEEHIRWMTDRQRQVKQESMPPVPWTRLGFTYDWGDLEHHIGLSEYVCREGSDLIVHSVHSALDYCTPGVVATL